MTGKTTTPHVTTQANRDVVTALRANGMNLEAIATYLKMDRKTLSKHYKKELATGFDVVLGAISGRLVQEAMAGKGWAICFWLKTRAGWRETLKLEHDGSIGLDAISDEELAERQQRLDAMETARSRKAVSS